MTNEHSLAFSLSEIRGVVFECQSCHGRVVFPRGRELDSGTIQKCPSCGTPWVFPPHATRPYVQLLNAMRDVEDAEREQGCPFTTRLEFNAPQ